MPTYQYEGLFEGKKTRGEIEAKNKELALKKLEEEGIIPLEIKEVKPSQGFSFNLKISFEKGISQQDLAFALIQLATLLQAGLPFTKALELLSNQIENEQLATAFKQIKAKIEKGESIYQAFKETGIFPDFLVEMLSGVQTGENLEYIFQISGEYLERISEIRSRVLSAVTYPAFVISFSLISVFISVKFVVPKIAQVLESFGKELPLVTKLIIFITNLGFYMLFIFPIGLLLFFHKEKFIEKETWDRIFLKIPILGKINLYINLARFSRVLSMLLKAAVPLPLALKLATKSISNSYLRKEFEKIIPEVEKGKSLPALIRNIPISEPLFVNLIETGTESGQLEKMLDLLSKTYEKMTFRIIDFWVQMIEPIAILLIALVVGIVVVSVMLPLADLTAGVK
jgi:type IV pilus assembly protein PilC